MINLLQIDNWFNIMTKSLWPLMQEWKTDGMDSATVCFMSVINESKIIAWLAKASGKTLIALWMPAVRGWVTNEKHSWKYSQMLKDYGIEAVRFSPFCDTPDEKGQLSKLRKTFLLNSLIDFNKFNVFHSVV